MASTSACLHKQRHVSKSAFCTLLCLAVRDRNPYLIAYATEQLDPGKTTLQNRYFREGKR